MILFRPMISPKINQQKISTPTRALGIASFIGFSRKAPEDESTLRLTTHAHTHTHTHMHAHHVQEKKIHTIQ